MQPIDDVLRKCIKSLGLGSGAVFKAVCNQWPKIVGEAVAAHTFPDMIKGGTLTIIVDSPQWMHHLGFYKAEIAGKLERYDIKEIRFRSGKLPPKKAAQAHEEAAVELSDEDRTFIENTVRNIEDAELRNTFRTLIAHGLSKGRKA
ncbi:MAG: DUF721 domain-containing protein [Nitrospirota bacterium]|nr:DUF721 domain-containing protein [Nitrospirota bacterium]